MKRVKRSAVVENIAKCPRCNSEHTVRHGFNVTIAGKRQRRKCQDCAHTFYQDELENQGGK